MLLLAHISGELMMSLLLSVLIMCVGMTAQSDGLFASAIMGDSITKQGSDKQLGHPNITCDMLKSVGVEIVVIPAGILGDTSKSIMPLRMQNDVLNKKPTWMFLLCGVNDILLVELSQYRKNIEEMHRLCQNNKINMFLIIPTVPRENGQYQDKIGPYVAFVREYAKSNNIPLATLNTWAPNEINKWDGATPSPLSHIAIAKKILINAGYDVSLIQQPVDVMMADALMGRRYRHGFSASGVTA